MSKPSQVESLFFAALEKGKAEERAAFLDSACGGDAKLRRQVEKLLNAHPRVGDFLRKPVGEQLAAASENSDATQEFDASTNSQGAVPTGRRGPSLAQTEGEGSGDDDHSDLNFLQPSTRPDSLGRLGHYEVLEVLGRGGFGIVFRAFDEVLQRVVAIKVLAPQLAAGSPARKRFLREARSSAKVRHENVVQVYAVEEQPLPYLVMEFIPGETLQQLLDRTGPLETAEVLQIGRQIAEGLAAAHGTGLIHRDVKPGNILIEAGPHKHVKITDFGLARAADDASLTQSGMVAGTPMFMAPEQASGDKLDHRADLFSMGSVLYTMCCGRPPFRANNTLAVLKRVAEDTPRPIQEIIPEVPQWLCEIITRLQAKKPEDRFASAQQVADLLTRRLTQMQHPEISQTLSHVPPATVENTPPREGPEAAPAMRRPRFRFRRWAAAATVLLLVVGGLGFTEATGVTDVHGSVIRLFSPEGTLVVEVDDPKVSVKIDGSDVVITGAGAKEIRLTPGRYTVEASKDGKVVSHELVTVTRNGRQVVRVSQEATPADVQSAKAADDPVAWERSVAAMPAEEQVKAVSARLKELNPHFDGKVEPTIDNGVATGLEFLTDQVSDIAPIRVLTRLQNLNIKGSGYGKGMLVDLTPIRGMPLTRLSTLDNPSVTDLSALKGMPLQILNVGGTGVTDLTPLKGMPLESLFMWGFWGSDLTPLKGMPLKWLNCGGRGKMLDLTPLSGLPLEFLCVNITQVSDLTPLKGMPLTGLECQNTLVSDLSPLKGTPLKHLGIGNSMATDLSPLKGMSLEEFGLTPKNITQGLDILRAMKSLKTIEAMDKIWPAAEFWEAYDKGEFKK